MQSRCLRAVATRAHRRPSWRLLSTTQEQFGSSSSNVDIVESVSQPLTNSSSDTPSVPSESTQSKTTGPLENKAKPLHKNARAAMVKVEHGIKSLPIGLAVVHEIERRFGRLRDFKLLPDKDAPGDYLPYLFVEFEHIHSLHRAHSQGSKTIKLNVQPWNREQMVDGGASLLDVQEYLRRPVSVQEDGNEDIVIVPEELVEAQTQTNPSTQSAEEHDAEALSEQEMDVSETVVEEQTDTYSRPTNQINIQVVPLGQDSKQHSFNSVHLSRNLSDVTRIFNSRSQTPFSQAFIRWGGFYPGYNFTDAGMEALAWRAQPFGTEPPASVISQAEESRYDLNNVYTDKEVERARRLNAAQKAMKAIIYKRRMVLKDVGTSPEVHGLKHDEANDSWKSIEATQGPSPSKLPGERNDMEVVRIFTQEWDQIKKTQTKEKAEAPEANDLAGVNLGTVEQKSDDSTVKVQAQRSTKLPRTPTTSTSRGPKVPNVKSPSTVLDSSPQKSKSKANRKSVSPPSNTATSTLHQTSTKKQRPVPQQQKEADQSFGEQDDLRSRLLGWLKGKW